MFFVALTLLFFLLYIERDMKVTVIGTGYVGLATGVSLSEKGHQVACIDINEEKIKMLRAGRSPIFEKDIEELLQKNIAEKRLFFDTEMGWAVRDSSVIFIAVGTPSLENGEADLSQVRSAAEGIGKSLGGKKYPFKVIANKSTVPIGTGDIVKEIISWHYRGPFDVISNPEFLREGNAIEDALHPDRIVIGDGDERARKLMLELYGDYNCPKVLTDVKSAEMIKYASNSMLATQISFINSIAQICEKLGADVRQVAEGMRLDKRIGPHAFLDAGIGYGGSCFPKDVAALIQMAKGAGFNFEMLRATEMVNKAQRQLVIEKVKEAVLDLKDKTVAVWGLAFKPGTDDLREAPAIDIVKSLQYYGAKIKAFDPVAEKNAKAILSDVVYCPNPYETVRGADVLVIATQWPQFRNLDLAKIKKLMVSPIIIDGRNVFDRAIMEKEGFNYQGIGQ
jgi:UDPglucose 6-dehydrogenase